MSSSQESIKSNNSGIFIFIFVLILIVCGVIYFFLDDIKDFFNTLFENEDHVNRIKELESNAEKEKKNKNELEKQIKDLKKQQNTQDKDIKEDTKQDISSLKQQYSTSTVLSQDGYCYIGTDENMRQCVEAYAGDTCTSGDIYNRMDDCLIPKLSNTQCGV